MGTRKIPVVEVSGSSRYGPDKDGIVEDMLDDTADAGVNGSAQLPFGNVADHIPGGDPVAGLNQRLAGNTDVLLERYIDPGHFERLLAQRGVVVVTEDIDPGGKAGDRDLPAVPDGVDGEFLPQQGLGNLLLLHRREQPGDHPVG